MKTTSCKKCGSNRTVKNGTQDNIQRFKCKNCDTIFRGNNPKYSADFKMEVVMMHLNSVGFRAIGRLKKIHNSLASFWVKKAGLVVREKFIKETAKITDKNIKILEIDELYTYIKKNQKMAVKLSLYGLLSVGTKTELLILK